MRCNLTLAPGLFVFVLAACGDPNFGGARGEGTQPGNSADPSQPVGPSVGPDGLLVGEDGLPVANPTTGPDGVVGPDQGPAGSGTVVVEGDDGQVLIDGMLVPVGGEPAPSPSGPADSSTIVDVAELPDAAEPVTSADVFLGSRLRRLTNVEYRNTIADLFGVEVDLSRLPPDARQNDFTRNIGQAVDPVLGGHFQTIAQEVASAAVATRLAEMAACAETTADEACARTMLEGFGQRLYRRPLESTEVDALLELYRAGADGEADAFPAGIEVVLQAMLQSASFLYLSEVGGGASPQTPGELVVLTPWELATSLSYLLTAHPPDDELWATAEDGSILEPAVREAQAARLLQSVDAEAQLQRFVKEWLKLDLVAKLDKADERIIDLRGPMERETDAFISDIAFAGDGRLSTMLTAGYTFVDAELADFYGVTPDASGRASLTGTGRLGLLQQASFLTANSQNDESGPVLRGVAVLRKVLCYNLPSPSDVDDPEVQMVMPPERDETLTTRERFAMHSSNPKCAACHSVIDPIGFSFENFGPLGELRDTDAGNPVDTTGTLSIGSSIDGPLVDSVDLAQKLAQDPRVAECFARQVYRYGSATNSPDAEATFMSGLGEPGTVSDDVKELLTALSRSNSFLLRKTPTAAEQL